MPSWSSGTENGFWNKGGGGMITFQEAQPKDKEHSEEQKSG